MHIKNFSALTAAVEKYSDVHWKVMGKLKRGHDRMTYM
jgi:hypothetical protein